MTHNTYAYQLDANFTVWQCKNHSEDKNDKRIRVLSLRDND